MQNQISYTEARNDLSSILNKVCANNEPVLITRRNGENAVIISESDWRSIQETLYLMSNSKDWLAVTESVKSDDCATILPW